MKKLTEEQLQDINEEMSDKGFLTKQEVSMFRDEFKYSYETFKRELMENQIPFESGNPANVLLSFGINLEDKKVELNEFVALGGWKLDLFKNSKIRAKFECQECGSESDSRLAKMIGREFFSLEPICSSCINKVVRNTDECQKRNSEAQLISQNRPEVKKKNREAQLKRFEGPEVIKKHSESGKKKWKDPEYREKMEKIAREKWKDPEYARKVIQNSKNGGLKGFYKSLYYDSGYELAWLMILESENKLCNIIRANTYIIYKNTKGKSSHYYPDFILDNKYLIEVKGYGPWADIDNISKKNEAAKIWCKSNGMRYRLVEFKDIGHHWYRKARNKHKELSNGEIKK
jgi:hypothetical protein